MTFNSIATLRAHNLKRVLLLFVGAVLLVASGMALSTRRAEAAACTTPAADYGTATSTIKIDNAATYKIWSRLLAPNATNNSYLLEVDGTNCYTVGDSAITANTWTWIDYKDGDANSKISLNLGVGDHTIKMIGREAGVKLGRVLFVSDTNCVPVDNGSNCTVAGDTTAPAVSITAPDASATVSGTVNITANATDNVAVTKVDFLVNGILAATDMNSPYSYSWNTTAVGNGPVSLAVKAYDAMNNVASDVRQVTVSNGDSQAPSTPTGVTAQANAYNKVTVKWAASTDNVAVKGYRVARDGVTLASVTTGTEYIDSTVLPNTTYSYQITAYDAANNVSGLSTVAKVTTPTPPVVDTQAPSAPTGVAATAAGRKQINLTWTPSTDNVGVVAYDVYRTTGSITAGKVATVTTASYGDTGLAGNTEYSYYIIARDSAGNASVKSETASAKTESKPQPGSGHIRGKVTFAKKRWWNRPQVTVFMQDHRRIYAVKSDGTYDISNLTAGTYKVKYSAVGARTQTLTIKVEAGKVKTQNVTLRAK